MGLRISTNIASENVQRNLSQVSGKSAENLARLSSGKRINKAADDAAGLAIAKNLEAQTTGLRQASRNANDGISLVQTAEGGLNEVSNILTRMRELTIQASSDTVGENERGYLDMEYQQLVEEVDRIANTTTFNGTNLLNGEVGGVMEFHVGANADERNRIEFDASKSNAQVSALGINGTGVAAKDNARNSIEKIDGAIDKVNSHRASLGSIQSRLQSTVANLDNQVVNQEAARSVIEDADIARETSELAANNVLSQAGVATLAQANSLPNSAMALI